jgi:PTH1 family peptidyl-tRNA hydrolase
MLTIIGLGNPGNQYEGTRHNVGFDVVDSLAKRLGETDWRRQKHLLNSEAIVFRFRGETIQLVKPATYMNESGLVAAALKKQGLDCERLWVIHDDTEIPFGEVRVKFGGTSGGHNGIKSIDNEIGPNYWRIRIGVGRPQNSQNDLADYVLSKFSATERRELPVIIDRVVSYLIKLMEEQIEAITFNAK